MGDARVSAEELRPVPPPPPPAATRPQVASVSFAEFVALLEHVVVLNDGGGGAVHRPLTCSDGSPELAAFAASFGSAASLAAACRALRVARVQPDASELRSLAVDELGARVPPQLARAIDRTRLTFFRPTFTAFLAHGRGQRCAPELSAGLEASLVVVLCGTLRAWVAQATLENVLRYGENRDRPLREYEHVQEATLTAGGALLVPPGCVFQMLCAGPGGGATAAAQLVAVALDFVAPNGGWDMAAQLAWRLRPARGEAPLARAAAAVAACWRLPDGSTADDARAALFDRSKSCWSHVGLQA